MRWSCPQCGRAVSVALDECPYCAAWPPEMEERGEQEREDQKEETQKKERVEEPSPPEPGPPPPPAASGPPSSAAAPPEQELPAAPPPMPRPRVPARTEGEEESPLLRGFRMGVGFMLAVVSVLLLIVVVLLWLSVKKPEWLDWLAWLGG